MLANFVSIPSSQAVIDVVVHVGVDTHGRYISGIHYDPQARWGDAA